MRVQASMAAVALPPCAATHAGSRYGSVFAIHAFGSDMSVALLAVGYIVNLRIAALITFGGALGWLVAIPLLGGADPSGDPIAVANALWSEKVRYIGVCNYTAWQVCKGLWTSDRLSLTPFRGIQHHYII